MTGSWQVDEPLMNLLLPFSWRFDKVPSDLSIDTSLSDEDLDSELEQPVPPFVATLLLHADYTFERMFPGGTVLSLLQFLYDIYQEPMTVAELEQMLNYSVQSTVDRYRGYLEQTLAGVAVPRSHVFFFPITVFNGIRDNKILASFLE